MDGAAVRLKAQGQLTIRGKSQCNRELQSKVPELPALKMPGDDGQQMLNRRSLLASMGVATVATLTAGDAVQVAANKSSLMPADLTCEHLTDPPGIDRPIPRLAWMFANTIYQERGCRQTAWQIIVASELNLLDPH